MSDHSHILNRMVIFTEIPGSPKLPEGTKLSAKKAGVGPLHDVVALTPSGQRYEFQSIHISNLLKTPWVTPVSAALAAVDAPQKPKINPPMPTPKENPFTIGDVTTVEDGMVNDSLPQLDVTGSSLKEDFGQGIDVVNAGNIEEVVVVAPPVEVKAEEKSEEKVEEVEASDDSSEEEDDVVDPSADPAAPKPKRGRKAK